MSIPKITGRQARELLDGTTPGPWEFFHDEWGHNDDGEARFEQWGVIGGSDGIMSSSPRESLFGADNGLVDEHDHAANLTLAAAAPDLAETVAWLYGREPDGPGAHIHRGRTGEYDQEAVAAHPEAGVVEVYAAHDHGQAPAFLTPDEAVDLARALLAAAEEARP